MRVSRERTATCAYDIEIRWGKGEGPSLYREHVASGAPFALVTGTNSKDNEAREFVVDEAWIGAERADLVSLRDGVPHAHDGQGVHALTPGRTVRRVIGPLEIVIAGSEPELHARAPEPLDVRRHSWTLASLFLHLLALGCMALLPPRASSLALDRIAEDTRTMRYLLAPVESEAATLPWRDGAAGTGGDSPKTAGEEGLAGGPSGAGGRLAVKGTATKRRVLKVDATNAGTQGLLGALAAQQALFGSASPYASGEALGYDALDALGRLYGSEIGASTGTGLGLKHAGRGGGGDALGTVGVGKLETRGGDSGGPPFAGGIPGRRLAHESRVPRVISHTADVHGSLSKEVIRRHIQLHIAELRFCYAEALRDRPELSGRVSVGFLITSSGAVQSARSVQSSLNAPGVEECVTRAIRRIAFPAPEGGGYVQVTYPFVFEPAD
jgi:TonB family protein